MNFIDIPKIIDYSGQPIRYIQEKMNGYFCEIYRGPNSDIKAFLKGRKEDIWPLLRMNVSIREPVMALPFNSVVFGELHHPDLKSASVVTWLKECNPALRFSAFACPLFAGFDCSADTLEVVNGSYLNRFDVPQYLRFLGDIYCLDDDAQNNYKLKAEAKKIEGYVLKLSHMDGWYKLKPVRTVDCFVVDYQMSTSLNFYGSLKSFSVAVYSKDVDMHPCGKIDVPIILAKVSTGLDHDFKRDGNDYTKAKQYIGKVMEVAYQEVLSKGQLQFPRFLRWRDDKDAKDCTIDQIQ